MTVLSLHTHVRICAHNHVRWLRRTALAFREVRLDHARVRDLLVAPDSPAVGQADLPLNVEHLAASGRGSARAIRAIRWHRYRRRPVGVPAFGAGSGAAAIRLAALIFRPSVGLGLDLGLLLLVVVVVVFIHRRRHRRREGACLRGPLARNVLFVRGLLIRHGQPLGARKHSILSGAA